MNYRESLFANDIIRYCGEEKADIRFFDGALRHAVGAQHFQVVRANREHPEEQEGCGWTYNHAPMLCYWNQHFFIEYLSDPVSEHTPPSQSLLVRSRDGIHWGKPEVVFPNYVLPQGVYGGPGRELLREGDGAVMHQRMGFYVTKSGRLFVLGFYGVCPQVHISPNNGYGIARVVREVYKDFTFSPVYVIRYNPFGGFTPQTVQLPFYKESEDTGFVQGCEELLGNKLVTRQWWEEQRFDTELFQQPGAAAFCWYTVSNNNVVGLYKNSLAARSRDGGKTWGELVKCRSIETSTGKMWGQKTQDGKFALVYNPTTDSMHRWPLAIATGSDGEHFSHLLALTTQVPPSHYAGWAKNLGPQYVRGISEGYPQPDDGYLWLVYSMNKEDIWICRVPVPVSGEETEPLNEDFACGAEKWNLYSPRWAQAGFNKQERCLELTDSDPCDKALAERVFMESFALTLQMELSPQSMGEAALYIDLADQKGAVPVRILFRADGYIYIKSGGVYQKSAAYQTGRRYGVEIKADCVCNEFSVRITDGDAELLSKAYRFSASVYSLERLVLQTKDQINPYGTESNGKDGSIKDWPDSGERRAETKFNVYKVSTADHVRVERNMD